MGFDYLPLAKTIVRKPASKMQGKEWKTKRVPATYRPRVQLITDALIDDESRANRIAGNMDLTTSVDTIGLGVRLDLSSGIRTHLLSICTLFKISPV